LSRPRCLFMQVGRGRVAQLAMPSEASPTISFARRAEADDGSFLAMGPATVGGQHRAHGLRVRKQAELMGITPGTSRLAQQTGEEKWVSAPSRPRQAAMKQAAKGEMEAPRTTKLAPRVARPVIDDEFYEGDPFEDAEEQNDHEVGEDDIMGAALEDEYEVEEEAFEEEEAAEEPVQRRSVTTGAKLPAQPRVIHKMEPKEESKVAKVVRAAPSNAPLAGWELFKVQKLNEADLRNTGAKAICHIKRCLRQQGAQVDGSSVTPADWDTAFMPVLGSFKKFILSRPDQFRIITGAEPGYFTIAIVPQEVVVAPEKGKGKGKGKDKDGKGKGKDKGKDQGGKSWGKGKGQTKGTKGAKPWGPVAPAGPPPGYAAPTRAASLLAAAAKDALAEEEEENLQNEEAAALDALNEEWADEDEDGAGGAIDDPIERLWQTGSDEPESNPSAVESAVAKKGEEADIPAERPTHHGSFMGLLGGLGSKRLGSGGLGAAKRRAI